MLQSYLLDLSKSLSDRGSFQHLADMKVTRLS
jgi:hypothetical protein